jgi:hypothetical protein
VGDAEIVATYEAFTATGKLTAGYDLSGMIHEADPLGHVPLSNANVEVMDGRWAGQKATTDNQGRFVLPGITAPGFSLSFWKPGYEALRWYGIVALPRDAHPNIALLPSQRTFTWEHTIGQAFEGGHIVEAISVSRTAPLSLILTLVQPPVAPGNFCNVQGTYTDFGASLTRTGNTTPDLRVWPRNYNGMTQEQIVPAGNYQLSIDWNDTRAFPSCFVSITVKYY